MTEKVSLIEAINVRIQVVQSLINNLRGYCQLKLNEGDYHGVQDAASDLRELVIERKTLELILNDLKN